MALATQLEVLDIRHFSARQLRPLLEQEAAVWQVRLRWDYRNSTELLLQYLDSRVLPGFVALDRGHVCGFSFCVYEGTKAVIGDAFAITTPSAPALDTTRLLLRHLIELVLNTPNVQRVESQLLLYDEGTIDETFTDAGFTLYPRLFLECDLMHARSSHVREPAAVRRPPTAFMPAFNQAASVEPGSIRRWSGVFYQATAELIHRCYLDHPDSQINDQYRTLHGSLRFLHNIVRFPGCGVFDPNNSWLLTEQGTNALIGVLLCSTVAPGVSHITQLCIARELRGKGHGRQLLAHAIDQLRQAGSAAITLTVTEQNTAALELYRQAGFHTRHRFEAMVRQTSSALQSFGIGVPGR